MSDPWPAPPPPGPTAWTQYPPGTPTSNGVATAAMVVGILTLLTVFSVIFSVVAFVPGIVAIVLGVVGVRRARAHPTGLGRGQAVAGIVCGSIGTVVSIGAIAIIALFVASADFTIVGERPAAPDDYELSDRTCKVDGLPAVAGGVLTNRSGAEHGFVVTVRFLDGPRELGSSSDELESDLGDGQSWDWQVAIPVDAQQVDTDGLDCRVEQVEIGDVVSD